MVNKLFFISNCTSSFGKQNCHFFSVPKLRLNEWQAVIAKPGLGARSMICYRHFEDSCFINGKVIQNVFHAFKNWRLLPETVLQWQTEKHFKL
ncbi:hypothetical protein DAPPUDRAFT_304169 [Daphnia pulex]|uniref:THAP-type domain-containing protein n=1 Tax=Daphnia pulex TaxID=6669 RepID=E9HTN6_DAPPU|nr:hypothetical protein DAPPUDRAFT_304169 [Daphnia pulex]|eukprot:EFX64895.1 hypothetical protein DAPPUDRAFT_304169 [Daphnia pulex]